MNTIMKQYILFNPNAGGGSTSEQFENNEDLQIPGFDNEIVDMTAIPSYKEFFGKIALGERVVVTGGDGTMHRFINDVADLNLRIDIYYYPSGTGNDFWNDIKDRETRKLVPLNRYVANLPKVRVNGTERYYLNNASFGIDGYCCEVGDAMREKGAKSINYTSIAIKGLLGGFKRVNATIEVDGMTKEFKNVWLAPTMNGRFCGGGMMLAPHQDRLNPEHTVSLMVMHCPLKLKTLMVFPSIFKGEHIKHTEMVEEFKGHNIKVKFDRPTAMQIDGETIRNVTEYSVTAG